MCVKKNLADITNLFTLHSVTLEQRCLQIGQTNLLQESQIKFLHPKEQNEFEMKMSLRWKEEKSADVCCDCLQVSYTTYPQMLQDSVLQHPSEGSFYNTNMVDVES